MTSIIRFFYTDYPDCIERVNLSIPRGCTVRDLVDLCAQMEGVTIPTEVMLDGKCIVEGRPVSEEFEFSGYESDVDFFDAVGLGC